MKSSIFNSSIETRHEDVRIISRNMEERNFQNTRPRGLEEEGRRIYLLAENAEECERAGTSCGVSPFSMTKSPPGQAKPGVENRKEKILISLSTVNEETVGLLRGQQNP